MLKNLLKKLFFLSCLILSFNLYAIDMNSLIEQGKMYYVFFNYNDPSTDFYLAITTGAKNEYLSIILNTEYNVKFEIWETATWSSLGNYHQPLNLNRNVSKNISIFFYDSPVSPLGNIIYEKYIPTGGKYIITGFVNSNFIILRKNSNYIIHLNYSNTSIKSTSIEFYIYEK